MCTAAESKCMVGSIITSTKKYTICIVPWSGVEPTGLVLSEHSDERCLTGVDAGAELAVNL